MHLPYSTRPLLHILLSLDVFPGYKTLGTLLLRCNRWTPPPRKQWFSCWAHTLQALESWVMRAVLRSCWTKQWEVWAWKHDAVILRADLLPINLQEVCQYFQDVAQRVLGFPIPFEVDDFSTLWTDATDALVGRSGLVIPRRALQGEPRHNRRRSSAFRNPVLPSRPVAPGNLPTGTTHAFL